MAWRTEQARLMDQDLAHARDQLPFRQVAVADHLAMALFIENATVLLDPLRNFASMA